MNGKWVFNLRFIQGERAHELEEVGWERGKKFEFAPITGGPKTERGGMKPEAASTNPAERFV